MDHQERRIRRREIAAYCRTRSRVEAAIAYGVTNAFVGAACREFGRNCVGIDIRESQVELSRRRCAEIQRMLVE